MKILQNFVAKNFWENKTERPSDQVEVVFSSAFMKIPHIVLSLERIDEGQFIETSSIKQDGKYLYHTVNRVEISASNVTETGFILNVKTWGHNLIYGYRVNWLAISDEDE